MADEIIEADGAFADDDETMFGTISEDFATTDEGLTDEQIEALRNLALDQYEATRDYGWDYEFDFDAKRFVMRGEDVATVTDEDTLAQWAMNALSTERFTALVYSDQFGVEMEDLVREGTAAYGLLEERVREALQVHDRIHDIRDFSAYQQGTTVVLRFVIETNNGTDVSVEGIIA